MISLAFLGYNQFKTTTELYSNGKLIFTFNDIQDSYSLIDQVYIDTHDLQKTQLPNGFTDSLTVCVLRGRKQKLKVSIYTSAENKDEFMIVQERENNEACYKLPQGSYNRILYRMRSELR